MTYRNEHLLVTTPIYKKYPVEAQKILDLFLDTEDKAGGSKNYQAFKNFWIESNDFSNVSFENFIFANKKYSKYYILETLRKYIESNIISETVLMDIKNRGGFYFKNENIMLDKSKDKLENLKNYQLSFIETATNSYRIFDLIDIGGNNYVFDAIDDNNKNVAIKYLFKTKDDAYIRFENEINLLINSPHQGSIVLLDFLFSDSCKFYVMPRYKGNLNLFIGKSSKIIDKLNIAKQLLTTIDFYNEKNIFHRDLKPENILFNSSSDFVISDFGIAYLKEEHYAKAHETPDSENVFNALYAAPEQKKRLKNYSKVDVFAIGLLLNQLFTGEIPNGSEYKHISDVYPDLEFLDYIVNNMICSNIKKRWTASFALQYLNFFITMINNVKKSVLNSGIVKATTNTNFLFKATPESIIDCQNDIDMSFYFSLKKFKYIDCIKERSALVVENITKSKRAKFSYGRERDVIFQTIGDIEVKYYPLRSLTLTYESILIHVKSNNYSRIFIYSLNYFGSYYKLNDISQIINDYYYRLDNLKITNLKIQDINNKINIDILFLFSQSLTHPFICFILNDQIFKFPFIQ